MIFDKVIDFIKELVKYGVISGYDIRLISVASRQVLRGEDSDFIAFLRPDEQHLRVVVGKVCRADHLLDECP